MNPRLRIIQLGSHESRVIVAAGIFDLQILNFSLSNAEREMTWSTRTILPFYFSLASDNLLIHGNRDCSISVLIKRIFELPGKFTRLRNWREEKTRDTFLEKFHESRSKDGFLLTFGLYNVWGYVAIKSFFSGFLFFLFFLIVRG